MEKDKGIFLNGKKRRKRKEGGLWGANAREMHRALGILLAAAMLFNTLFGGGLSVYAVNKSAPVEEGTPDLELFGQKVSNGDSGDGWSYADGVLTLENFHSDNSSGNFIHITNAPLEFTIYVKGENSVNTSGTLFYGNVRGSTTIMGDEGASLSLEGQNWNDKDIFIRGVNVNVTTQGMIFLSHNMVIDNAMVNFNMNGSNGYIYNTHGGLTIENGSEVNITNSSGSVDYCVATNKTEIDDSTLNITNPSGFGVYVTAISKEVPEHKAFITNSTISADVLDAGIHCEDEVSVTNSQVTSSGRFLFRSKERINVDNSSTMEGITYEFFQSAMGAAYQVYGTHALAADLTVAADGSFVIPEGAALTIPNGVILENNGMMRIHEKASLTGTGALTGNGNFLIDVNKDMISIPEGLTYTGKDYTDQIMLEKKITICGVEFTANTEGWTRNIEPAVVKDVGDYTVTFTNGDRTISRDFKVMECPHTGLVYKPLAGGKHGGTCPLCNEEISEEHTIECSATASGTVISVHEACAACSYGKDLGTVTIHIPELVYGDLTGLISVETTLEKWESVSVGGDWSAEKVVLDDTTLPPFTMADLTNNILLDAEQHTLQVAIMIDSGGPENPGVRKLVDCELTFEVAPAPLTADMVTLDKTEVTYNGAEQKPTLTVKQGKTTLTAGTDYSVSYTRDKVATIDFTSAGIVKFTVIGKGNYKGEVEETFTIKQAEPDVGTVTAGALENTLDVSQVVLSRTNQTPAGTLTLTDSTLKYGTNTYTWKFTPDDTVNYKAVTGEVQIMVNDTIPPTAEYQTTTDGWKKFINTVSFGVFCKDYKTVEIRGTDNTDTVTGSGVRLTQYYISDKEITDTDSIAWNAYTKPVSLNAQGTYLIYVKVTDNAGNTAVLNSEGIVVYAESTVSPAAFDYTYKENHDCTVQLALNGNTFKGLTDKEGNAVDTNHYTIDSDGTLILKAAYLDTLDKGEYTYKISVNPQGIETEQVTLAYTFAVNVKAKELTVTEAKATDRAYDGTNAVEITAVTLSGAAPDDDVAIALKNGIQGTLSSVNAGTYTAVTLPELTLTGADSGNYTLVQPAAAVSTSVTVTPLDAEITVGTDAYNKTFGDAVFTLDVTDNNTEADVQYEVTKGADVVSVESGAVMIKGVGEAEITVSLPKSANYNAAENKTITVTVKKKSGYTVAALNRNYYYQDGGTDSIDFEVLLPEDCGNVTYGEPAVSGDVTYSAAPAVSGGKLSYTLSKGNVDAGGTITVTVATQNYEDIMVTVNVKLTDQMPVSLKTGTEVTLKNNVLTYGEALSNLVFNEAEFVGSDGKTVAGTLAWKDTAAKPNAGTVSAVWIFTPEENKYASLEGTTAITVNKVTPTVSAVPTVADRVYNPSITLKGDALFGGTVTGVDGKELKGGWNWQSADIVPTVNNSGYVAVFTPSDTANYNSVEAKVKLTVNKAQNAPNMPSSSMSVRNSLEKAGDVPLPEGWEWQASDRDTVLKAGVPVSAVAVYTGADKGNYEKETVTVVITRAARSNEGGDIPYTGTGDKEPAGMKDVEKNSAKLDSGISVKWKGSALDLKWTKIAKAGGYDIYAAQCGKKRNKKSPSKTVKNGKTSVSLTKIAGKKISGKKAYAVKIKAWKYVNGKKVYAGSSRTYHIAGKENKKYTNAKKLKPKKKKYTLKKGRSVRIKITIAKQSKKKKLLPVSHGPALWYWSGNKKIATVTQEGKVKAKKKGTCYIYVTALNGVRTKIKITVK